MFTIAKRESGLLNVKNGLLDLKTDDGRFLMDVEGKYPVKIKSHTPYHISVSQIPCNFDIKKSAFILDNGVQIKVNKKDLCILYEAQCQDEAEIFERGKKKYKRKKVQRNIQSDLFEQLMKSEFR